MEEPQVCVFFVGGCPWGSWGKTCTLLFISLNVSAQSSCERSTFHLISHSYTIITVCGTRVSFALQRCNQASQQKAELICVSLHQLTWTFSLSQHDCPWKQRVTLPVCMFLYVSLFVWWRILWIYFRALREKKTEGQITGSLIRQKFNSPWREGDCDHSMMQIHRLNIVLRGFFRTREDYSCRPKFEWNLPVNIQGRCCRKIIQSVFLLLYFKPCPASVSSRVCPERQVTGWQKSKFIRL